MTLANENEPKTPFMTDGTYNVAKDVVTLVFPALAVLYSALSVLWGWPFEKEVVGTISALVVFLGVLLKVNSNRYKKAEQVYDGALVANDPDPDQDTFRLEFDHTLSDLSNKDVVRLKVVDLLPKE